MIYIEVLKRKWNPGKKMLEDEKETRKFEKFMGNEFIKLCIKAIDEQRYKWQPLDLEYEYVKYRKGLSLNIWEATGELKNHLKFKERTGRIGFTKGKHSKAKMTYVKLARILEYGTLRIPPRPLFRNVYRYMNNNMAFFLNKFRKEVGK